MSAPAEWMTRLPLIGDVQAHRLLGVDVHTVAHRLLSPVRVAAMHRRQVANPSYGIVEDLGAEVAGEVFAGGLDRMSRADVRARRHREHIRGLGDEQAG